MLLLWWNHLLCFLVKCMRLLYVLMSSFLPFVCDSFWPWLLWCSILNCLNFFKFLIMFFVALFLFNLTMKLNVLRVCSVADFKIIFVVCYVGRLFKPLVCFLFS